MASTKSRTKRNVVDIISFTIPGHDTYQMTVKEIVSKIEKDRIENMDEAVQTLIAVWTTIACRTENLSNVADIFHSLFRKTSLTILSVRWIKVTSAQKRQMAKVLTKCSQVFGPLVEKATRLCTVLVMAVYDPWGEPALNQLVEGQIDFTDTSVGEFINSEPEELLLTRVESLTEAGHVNAAIELCKSCLRHCTTIMTKSEQNCHSPNKTEKDKAYPFIENMLVLLHNQGEYAEIIKEAAKLKCHDGIKLIEEISSKCASGDASLPEMLSHFFLARDISLPSTYCCTKELMNLWCKLQVMQQRSIQEISNSAQRLICHASSSAYFYLFVDRLWCQFGNSLLPLYLEMYVRGITSDMNFLDVVRVAGPPSKTMEMESHLAFIFTKLSSLFSGLYDEVALECLLTAYSFAPAKEKLDKIHKMKERVSRRINSVVKSFDKCIEANNPNSLTGKCTCEGRCTTPIKDNQNIMCSSEEICSVYSYHFPHLILDGEIKGVPYLLLKDFVSVLECMRYRHLRASDDWEIIKTNCQEYLEKWTTPKITETSCNDSADSEMDSVSEDGDDNIIEIKIPRAEEIYRKQEICAQSLLSKFRKDLKPKSHQKQRHHNEDTFSVESQDPSRNLTYNNIDKEIKKRKKKRKTKREKDREAFLRKQFEESNSAMLMHDNKERQNRKSSSLETFSGVRNEFADVSRQEMKVLITQVNPKLSGGEFKIEESYSTPENIQNRTPIVVLSDILSDTVIDSSKNDGICKNDFRRHYGEKLLLPVKSDSRKEIIINEHKTSEAIPNSNATASPPQQILNKLVEHSDIYIKPNNDIKSSLFSASHSNPSSEHKELPLADQKLATITELKSVLVTEQKLYAKNNKLENCSANLPVPTVRPDITAVCPADSIPACVSNDKELSKSELQEKNKEDMPTNEHTIQVSSIVSNSSCTVTSIPLDSLPKKLQVQVERKSIIPPVATLSIPLPLLKHSTGNKVLSGRLVIPVNRLQRAVSSASSNSIKVEGDTSCSKKQMLSIPNVILMKRNVNSDISDEETGSKRITMNKGSKNQKRMWATVRNLHGSIEWRKISENEGGITFQQKPLCAAKLRSGGVALSGPLYVSTEKEDKNDIPVTAVRNISPPILNVAENCINMTCGSNVECVQTTVNTIPDSKLVSSPLCAATKTVSSIPIPVSSGPTTESSQGTTDTNLRNDSGIVYTPLDIQASGNSFTTGSIADLGVAQNILAVTHSSATKPGVTKKDHTLKLIAALDNTFNTNIAGVLPMATRTTVKEIKPSTSTTEKGSAKNIIRLMPGGPGICENKIDFTRTLPTVSTTNICSQTAVTKSKSNFMEALDSDLPVNLSLPKKPSTVCPDKEFQDCQTAFDNKPYPLRNSQIFSSSCKIELGSSPPIDHSALYNKASSTLQMLLAHSDIPSVEQNKCSDQPTSTMPISSNKALNKAVDKSLSVIPSASTVSSRDIALDFKKAYPNTNTNCYVGLDPLNTQPPDAKLSAIVANNTSRLKKEQNQNIPPKEVTCKLSATNNKEPFDVVKLIGQIRELANAEAEKAAKTKERRRSSQKDAINENKNRKLSSKKSVESSIKTNSATVPKKYTCVLCSSSLAQKYSLKRHYRDVHGMEVSPEQSSESIVKQFNDITSSTDGTYFTKNTKRNRIKVLPQKNMVSSSLLSLADAAESEMQKTQQALPAVDVAFPHLNIFHQTSSHITSMPSHHIAQNNMVPMFPAASTSTSYYPQQNINSSVLKWSGNAHTVSSAENTLEALALDNNFYNSRVSDKPLPELGDCRSVLNESKLVSTGDISLPVPSSFCTGNINFKGTHMEHCNNSRTVVNNNINSNVLAISSNKNLPLTNYERPQDVDRTSKIPTPERKFDKDNKTSFNASKEWNKDLKQISVNCIKLDNIYNQTASNFEIRNSCISTASSNSKLELNYQNVDCFSTYHNRKHGERTLDGSSDNAVDSEVSKLVAYMLHIDKKPCSEQKHITENLRDDSDGEMKLQESSLYKQDKSNEENKSDTLKSMRQRTRVRHSPNSGLKRSCPCCQDSEASVSAKKCRNISNVSRLARPLAPPWVNLERTNVQQRRSRKSLPSISTRSSKRLRTRSSTTSLT